MAQSPAHQFGQIIGDLLEAAIEPLLQAFATERGLYLDRKGDRPARKGRKVTWTDRNNNKHDLDFVLERGGAPEKVGDPAAFIETAWRRYTKHSKNKAQEIQGALVPLRDAYGGHGPFIGAILAGDFTEPALAQLQSLGFVVAYFPYQTVMEAFDRSGLDANTSETTSGEELTAKVAAWHALTPARQKGVAEQLIAINRKTIDEFLVRLSNAVLRTVRVIRILALHGSSVEFASAGEAVVFLEQYNERSTDAATARYEVEIRFINGESITGNFVDKAGVRSFLLPYSVDL